MAETKTRKYVSVFVDAGSGRQGEIQIPDDAAKYFGITVDNYQQTPVDPASNEPKLIDVKNVKRTVYSGLDDTTGTTITYNLKYYYVPQERSGGRFAGKTIRLPTALKTKKGNTRFVSFRCSPILATAPISFWLAKAITKQKPAYFLTESGNKVFVVPGTGITDVNPGNQDKQAGN